MTYLGRISYGIYLYHHFVSLILKWAWKALGIEVAMGIPVVLANWSANITSRYPTKLSAVVILILSMSIAVGLASLSWFLVERPVGRLRKRIGASRKPPVAPAYTPATESA